MPCLPAGRNYGMILIKFIGLDEEQISNNGEQNV